MKLADMENALNEAVRTGQIPGGAAAYVSGSSRMISASGICGGNEPFTPKTRVRIGCNAKPLLATLLSRYLASGALSLKSRLSEFFCIDTSAGDIMIEDLLTHKHGLEVNHLVHIPKSSNSMIDVKQLIDDLRVAPHRGKVSYGNVGYWLLSAILESIEGRSYKEVLFDRLLHPLGVDATLDKSPTAIGHRMNGNAPGFSQISAKFEDLCPSSGGDLEMSLLDLCEFCRLHIDEGYALRTEFAIGVLCQGFSPTPVYSPYKSGFTSGWVRYSREQVGFSGNGIGHHSFIRIDERRSEAYVFVANTVPAHGTYHNVFGDKLQWPSEDSAECQEEITCEDENGLYISNQFLVIISGDSNGKKAEIHLYPEMKLIASSTLNKLGNGRYYSEENYANLETIPAPFGRSEIPADMVVPSLFFFSKINGMIFLWDDATLYTKMPHQPPE